MAVKYELRRKTVTSGNLVLEAEADESIEILDFGIKGAAAASYLDVIIQQTTMNRFIVDDTNSNQLPLMDANVSNPSIFLDLKKRAPIEIPTYKLAAGQKLTLSPSGAYTRLTVHYKVFDAGDITEDMDGGLRGAKKLFTIYGTNLVAGTASGWIDINKSMAQKGHSHFPFEKAVPAGVRYNLFHIGVVPTKAAGTTKINNTRFWIEKNLAFSPDKDGFVTSDAAENEMPMGDDAQHIPRLMLPAIYVADAGDSWEIQQDLFHDGANNYPASTSVVCIMGIEERI